MAYLTRRFQHLNVCSFHCVSLGAVVKPSAVSINDIPEFWGIKVRDVSAHEGWNTFDLGSANAWNGDRWNKYGWYCIRYEHGRYNILHTFCSRRGSRKDGGIWVRGMAIGFGCCPHNIARLWARSVLKSDEIVNVDYLHLSWTHCPLTEFGAGLLYREIHIAQSPGSFWCMLLWYSCGTYFWFWCCKM